MFRLTLALATIALSTTAFAEDDVWGFRALEPFTPPPEVVEQAAQDRDSLREYTYYQTELEMARQENMLLKQKNDDLFNYISTNGVNVPPELVEETRAKQYEVEKAKNKPPVKSTPARLNVEIDPTTNNKPIEVFVESGNPTNILFFDASGAPWPLESRSTGDETEFGVQILGEKSNKIEVRIKKPGAEQTILAQLKGVDIPLEITLKTASGSHHSIVTVKLRDFGPEAEMPTIVGYESDHKYQDKFNAYIAGVPPDESIPLVVEGADVEAWLDEVEEGHFVTFIRSRSELLSPAYPAVQRGPNGVAVYMIDMRDVGVVSLLTSDGKRTFATLREPEEGVLQ